MTRKWRSVGFIATGDVFTCDIPRRVGAHEISLEAGAVAQWLRRPG